jgi:hypothetical protein
MMDCLLAKCALSRVRTHACRRSLTGGPSAGIPIITDCVMAELEKLGTLYKVALK